LKYELMRDVMRKWWKENEKFFREKNYQAVRPPDLDVSQPRGTPAPSPVPHTKASIEIPIATPSPT
jgi:hypothetical protein